MVCYAALCNFHTSPLRCVPALCVQTPISPHGIGQHRSNLAAHPHATWPGPETLFYERGFSSIGCFWSTGLFTGDDSSWMCQCVLHENAVSSSKARQLQHTGPNERTRLTWSATTLKDFRG